MNIFIGKEDKRLLTWNNVHSRLLSKNEGTKLYIQFDIILVKQKQKTKDTYV